MSKFNRRSSFKKIAYSSSILLALSGGMLFNFGVDKAIANPSEPQGVTNLETTNVSAISSTETVCNGSGDDCADKSFGTGNDIKLTGFSVGEQYYSLQELVDEVKFQRVNNDQVEGERHIFFLERDSNNNIVSTDFSTMEDAVRSEFINRGTDNVFANLGGVNENNIERVDFLIDGGLTVNSQFLNNAGFLLLERGGNDPFKVAAITAVDSNGNPTAFGNLISVPKSTWGNSGIGVKTNVYQNEVDNDEWPGYRKTAELSSQNIHGIFISVASLGIDINDTIYGYALFPSDINSSNDLVGLSDFPQDTSTNSGEGGLDLISSGGFFVPQYAD